MRYPAILAAALAAAIALPAAAETVAVEYADLDLSTKAGQDQLERRIDNAARAVCGVDNARTGTRLRSQDAKDCYAEAKAQVHAQIAEAISRDRNRG
jgi:UrcA family protein